MSEDCKGCGYPGGPDQEHIEHAHAVASNRTLQARELARQLVEQQKKHAAVIAVLQGQKKNRMMLGMSKEIVRLRGELEQALRALGERTKDLRSSIGLEDRP